MFSDSNQNLPKNTGNGLFITRDVILSNFTIALCYWLNTLL